MIQIGLVCFLSTLGCLSHVTEVRLTNRPVDFSFDVDGHSIGTSELALVDYLNSNLIRDIILQSEYKMTPEDSSDLQRLLATNGLDVLQFWAPISIDTPSPRPGYTDHLRR